jgi:hypothetical protein
MLALITELRPSGLELSVPFCRQSVRSACDLITVTYFAVARVLLEAAAQEESVNV